MHTMTGTTTSVAGRPPAGGDPSDLLRRVLRIDGWGTAAFGGVLLAGGTALSGPLGLPTSWSVPFGVAMLGGAAALGLIAGYPRIPPRLAVSVVAASALSSAGLLLLAVTGVLPLTDLGVAFLLVGALVVAGFAGLEFAGLRRSLRAGR